MHWQMFTVPYFRRTPDVIEFVVLEAVQRVVYTVPKSGDFINVFPSVISVLGTLIQIFNRMWELQETGWVEFQSPDQYTRPQNICLLGGVKL